MGKLSPEEKKARENLTRWFLHFREAFYLREGKPDIRFAADLKVGRSLVSDVVAGKKTVGFDVALKMRHFFKRKLDELVYHPPPAEETGAEAVASPQKRPASSERHHRSAS